jgi:NitT/TauT family transport system substrate-binding protein
MKSFPRFFSRSVIIGLLALAALLAAGYAWHMPTSRFRAAPLERVIIANTAYAGTCPILAAQAQGYFENEGVLVEIQPHTTGKAALDAALGGQADLGTSADLPVMFAVMKKRLVSVIATIFVTEKDYGVVGRRDKKIVTPAGLKGKRIGVTVNTSGHFFLDAFLNRQKLSAGDVQLRDFKPEQLADALSRGDVDAVATWEPYLGVMREQLGGNEATFFAEGVYDSVYLVSGTRDYVASHPETVKKVLRAFTRGARFCKETPEAASEIVATAINADAMKLKQRWPSYRFNVSLDQSLVLALEDETRWAIKNKLTDSSAMPNYLDYIHLDGLRAVAPAAVTVIH